MLVKVQLKSWPESKSEFGSVIPDYTTQFSETAGDPRMSSEDPDPQTTYLSGDESAGDRVIKVRP